MAEHQESAPQGPIANALVRHRANLGAYADDSATLLDELVRTMRQDCVVPGTCVDQRIGGDIASEVWS